MLGHLVLRRLGIILAIVCVAGPHVHAQSDLDPSVAGNPEAGLSQQDLQELEAARVSSETPPPPEPNAGLKNSLNFLGLLIDGGWLMVPIGVMSLLVVAIAFERAIALRKSRLFPKGLAMEILRASEEPGAVAPQRLFEAAERFPSAAARVTQNLLQKVGRPVVEAEAAIESGVQREADALYGNVRWLTLAAAVTPLIGLLGTVWGMIIAFYETTQISVGMNKAEFLAEGIYVALVTTLGGLAVAIPAAIFAHYFEGQITSSMNSIEAALKNVVPRLEDFEGRTRFDINSRGLVKRDIPSPQSNVKRRSAAKETLETPPVGS